MFRFVEIHAGLPRLIMKSDTSLILGVRNTVRQSDVRTAQVKGPCLVRMDWDSF